MSKTSQELASEYMQLAKHIGGCGDGGCVILRPSGMHTNGGCQCGKHMNAAQAARVRSLLSKAQQLATLLSGDKT